MRITEQKHIKENMHTTVQQTSKITEQQTQEQKGLHSVKISH